MLSSELFFYFCRIHPFKVFFKLITNSTHIILNQLNHYFRRYHGTMDERQTIKRNLSQFLPSDKGLGQKNTETSLDVVLTTYSYFSSEKSDDRSFLRKFQWNYVSHSIVSAECDR